jgi:hypothetical protein
MRTRKATKPLIAKPRRHADRQTIVLISVAEWYCGDKSPRGRGALPSGSNQLQRLPRRPLRCVPRRALPPRARRARGSAPVLLVVPSELDVVALASHADRDPSAESEEGHVTATEWLSLRECSSSPARRNTRIGTTGQQGMPGPTCGQVATATRPAGVNRQAWRRRSAQRRRLYAAERRDAHQRGGAIRRWVVGLVSPPRWSTASEGSRRECCS